MSDRQLDERMRDYAKRRRLKFNIKQQVGGGTDGAVGAVRRNAKERTHASSARRTIDVNVWRLVIEPRRLDSR